MADTSIELIVAGGTVVDGSDGPARRVDVGIGDGRIVAIGDLAAVAAPRIASAGHVVAPGFVDLHSHSDLTLLSDGRARSKVEQGVTTEVDGNCGLGVVPSPSNLLPRVRAAASSIDPDPRVAWDWTDLPGYAAAVVRARPALDVVPLVGHVPLRIAVAGEAGRPLTAEERRDLVRLVDACLDDGAAGISTGLMYPPAMSADLDELVAIARAVARRDRLFAIHMRNYSDRLLAAVDEALEIGRRSGCRLQISHLAVAGRRNWGAVPRALERIDRAADLGLDVAVDIYPYTAGSANLSQLLPDWVQAGGAAAIVERLADRAERKRIREDWQTSLFFGWDEIEVSSCEDGMEDALGLSVEAVAAAWRIDPAEAALDLIERSGNRVQMVAHGRSEADLRAVLTHPLTSIGSDGLAMDPDGPSSAGLPHPRSFGCYPRLLGRYVHELGVLRLDEAIRMATVRPAARIGLRDRGRVAVGARADLVVFDPTTVVDSATFREPTLQPSGIRHVLVAGRVVVSEGRQIGDVRPGHVVLS